MTRLWRTFTNWLERGDLVPLLIIASGYHYVRVLMAFEPWWVAAPIGLLVDLGQFRTVLIAVRYGGDRRTEKYGRWLVACVMTAVSFAYHLRFYWPDTWLAVPMPLLIAVLAYFDRKDAQAGRKRAKDTKCDTADTENNTHPAVYRECKPCDFTAYSSHAWAGHCKSKRHKEAISDITRDA